MATYVLRHILEYAGLQRHVHVDGADDPAQLPLADVQDPVHLGRSLAAQNSALPCCNRNLFDRRLYLGKAQKVYIGKLLLVLAVLGEGKAVEGLVVRLGPLQKLWCVLAEASKKSD